MQTKLKITIKQLLGSYPMSSGQNTFFFPQVSFPLDIIRIVFILLSVSCSCFREFKDVESFVMCSEERVTHFYSASLVSTLFIVMRTFSLVKKLHMHGLAFGLLSTLLPLRKEKAQSLSYS